MNVVRWQPRTSVARSRDLDSVQNDFDRLFDWALGGSELGNWTRPMVPSMDVVEEESRYVVRADLPGVTHEDIEITYQDGILTLKGEKRRVEGEERKSGRVYLRERFEGKFGRNLQLPQKIDVDKIEATFRDGVLELVLPFIPEAQPRKIEIRK